jgi:hypothetical protein
MGKVISGGSKTLVFGQSRTHRRLLDLRGSELRRAILASLVVIDRIFPFQDSHPTRRRLTGLVGLSIILARVTV